MQLRKLPRELRNAYGRSDVHGRVKHYGEWLERWSADEGGDRAYDHAETVREYYDLCNELMVYGWGESLHFAPLSPHESLEESKTRHQRLMISKLEMSEGMSVIDVGCGIGGPLRRVVNEAGVRVTGINYSAVQLARAQSLNTEAGLDDMVDFIECSFMDMDAIAEDTYDRGYAIESTCHAPDKAGAFAEIYRVLKPGALFWGQEMCLTDAFDANDPQHQDMKQELMLGIALKDIATMSEVNQALEQAGFELIEGIDRGVVPEGDDATPWYEPMESRGGSLGKALRRIPLGRKAFIGASRLAEVTRLFPKGSTEVAKLLDRTANAYVAGGKTGIFTPLYCFLARKPL